MINDTIVAIATAPINQAISIIRISGEESLNIISKLTKKDLNKFEPNRCLYSRIYDYDNNIVDEVIVHFYKNPQSFTGEDVVEINCHGGVVVTKRILELAIGQGARMAKRGEFSRRAFLNNKIDLTQAEAINDLINAKSILQSTIEVNNITGSTHNLIKGLQDSLLETIAICEVNIDYPEYDDIENIDTAKLIKKLTVFNDRLKTIIANSKEAIHIHEGIKLAIVGLPNVGKSSLLNALIQKEHAIVTDIAGTTRDRVEVSFNLDGLVITLIDTAGIRKTDNKIEIIGIDKSYQAIKEADLILFVSDINRKLSEDEKNLYLKIKKYNHLLILNKSDLKNKFSDKFSNINLKAIEISAINKNINNLTTAIKDKFISPEFNVNNKDMLINQRHLGLLIQSMNNIEDALNSLKQQMTPDIVLTDLQDSWNNLLEILGRSHKTTLLDEIFKKFCLGK